MNTTADDYITTADVGLPPDRYLPLTHACKLIGVPYHTLITANREGRLKLVRHEVGAEVQLYIEAIVLCEYMVYTVRRKFRWKSKLVPVAWIEVRDELQPRRHPKDPELLQKLDAHLLSGGAAEPIWCMKECRATVLVDGARRLAAYRMRDRKRIRIILLPLPFAYAASIAFERNTRHGRNLGEADQRKRVITFLAAHPGERQLLNEGKLTQVQLAKTIGVSEPTLSRALAAEKSVEPSPLPIEEILRGILTALKKCVRGAMTPIESRQLIIVGHKTFAALYSQLPAKDRTALMNSLQENTSIFARGIPPCLRGLLDRRGGDRRSPSHHQPSKS